MMDTNSYLILGLCALVLLNALLRRAGDSSYLYLARIERKLDLLLEKFEINPTAEVDPDIVALARSGNKIEAIRRYRQMTGVGLKEAKDYVDRL
jgi:hypothetical protein